MADNPRPPGWYQHPGDRSLLLYWDGQIWTGHTAPVGSVPQAATVPAGPAPQAAPAVAPGSAAAPGVTRLDSTYAWTIASIPLAAIVVAYFAPAAGVSQWAVAATWGVTIVLAVLDQRQLAERGVEVPIGWAILLVPGYLIARTVKARSTPAIPILWFATFGLSVLASFTFAAAYEFNADEFESDIEQWAAQQGVRGQAECPDQGAVREGQSVDCTFTDRRGNSGIVRVEMSNGSYTWNWVTG